MSRPSIHRGACGLLALGLSGGLIAAEPASDYTVRIIGGAWFASLGGDFSYDDARRVALDHLNDERDAAEVTVEEITDTAPPGFEDVVPWGDDHDATVSERLFPPPSGDR